MKHLSLLLVAALIAATGCASQPVATKAVVPGPDAPSWRVEPPTIVDQDPPEGVRIRDETDEPGTDDIVTTTPPIRTPRPDVIVKNDRRPKPRRDPDAFRKYLDQELARVERILYGDSEPQTRRDAAGFAMGQDQTRPSGSAVLARLTSRVRETESALRALEQKAAGVFEATGKLPTDLIQEIAAHRDDLQQLRVELMAEKLGIEGTEPGHKEAK